MSTDHAHSRASSSKTKLKTVFLLTGSYLIAELVGAWLTKSLALFADAGHMFTDVAAVGLALFAIKITERPASPERTYGYYRAEILAALINAIVLIGISVYILFEAYQRFLHPPKVESLGMLAVASIGLAINLIAMRILNEGSKNSLNLKAAYFEVLSDMLTSVGVIIAGIIMLTTGWYYADPIVSAGIGLFILPRTWTLLKEAVGVLLEGTPADVNLAEIRIAMNAIEGVEAVHDLHVWALTSGVNAMSAHAVLSGEAAPEVVLKALHEKMTKDFSINHVTIQLEPQGWEEGESHL